MDCHNKGGPQIPIPNLIEKYSVYVVHMIYLLTAIGLTPGDSSTVHIYIQKVCVTTQITTEQHK
jgi:hypothetical protein